MNPRIAVIRFPGSNCDQDCLIALNALGADASCLWHKEASVEQFDAVVLPGGFSYGDYLRCGAIARFSPVMESVVRQAAAGMPVLGICNGFQILCEAGLLPGALIRNRSLHFICEFVHLRVENAQTPFTRLCAEGETLEVPIAHGEGNYTADPATLQSLNDEERVVFRYCSSDGTPGETSNPNGSAEHIAGICNRERNILGMMPHPERAYEMRLGSSDGRKILESFIQYLKSQVAPIA